jgi:uncharacterized membrane protein
MKKQWLKNNLLQRTWTASSGPERMLLITSAFGIVLFAIRWIMTGRPFFSFLPWNLLLAYIPYYISKRLQHQPRWIEDGKRLLLVFIPWLLFIPNSFYIITDLFHLQLRDDSSRWFDLVLIFTFAWSGLLLGIVSVSQMTRIIMHRFAISYELLFLLPLMSLIAWGVYIGRYMRFNSWDVLTNPFELLGDVGYMLIHPFRHAYSWSMVACFAVLLLLLYLSVKRLGKSVE